MNLIMVVYTFWMFILNTGGCLFTLENVQGSLSPAQRECCSAFLSEDALPQICFEKGIGCPPFQLFADDEGKSKDIQHPGPVVVKSAALALFVLTLLLASAITKRQNIWMGIVEAVKRAVCIVQHCVALKAIEMALALVCWFLLAPGDAIYTMFMTHVEFSSTWGISVAVAGILLGTSQLRRVPQLGERGLYILIEYVYSSVVFLIVLTMTGYTTFSNLWTCLQGAGLPILVLLIVWGRRRMARREAGDDDSWDKIDFYIGRRRDRFREPLIFLASSSDGMLDDYWGLEEIMGV